MVGILKRLLVGRPLSSAQMEEQKIPKTIALAVYLVVRLTRPSVKRTDARAILDERLARGEIDPEEYRSRLAVLGS